MKKKNVRTPIDRRNPDLSGYLYLPLDRRKPGNEPVLSRLHRGKRGPSDGDENYDLNDLPCTDYERMHMT